MEQIQYGCTLSQPQGAHSFGYAVTSTAGADGCWGGGAAAAHASYNSPDTSAQGVGGCCGGVAAAAVAASYRSSTLLSMGSSSLGSNTGCSPGACTTSSGCFMFPGDPRKDGLLVECSSSSSSTGTALSARGLPAGAKGGFDCDSDTPACTASTFPSCRVTLGADTLTSAVDCAGACMLCMLVFVGSGATSAEATGSNDSAGVATRAPDTGWGLQLAVTSASREGCDFALTITATGATGEDSSASCCTAAQAPHTCTSSANAGGWVVLDTKYATQPRCPKSHQGKTQKHMATAEASTPE